MKQAKNNEMDLLLRGLARRKAVFIDSSADGDDLGAHLNADELNAYAEHALPDATRSRYTAHLADCRRCRKLVFELTLAAGLTTSRQVEAPEAEVGFGQAIRQFFSLTWLRYAVPVIAVLGIAAIGLIVFRQSSESSYVAQNQPAASSDPAVTFEVQSGAPTAVNSGETSDSGSRTFDSATESEGNRQCGIDEREAKRVTTSGATASAGAKSAPAEKAAEVEDLPAFAPEPTATPASPYAVADARKDADTRTESAARPQSAPPKKEVDDKDALARGKRAPEEERARDKVGVRENQVAAGRRAPPAPGISKLGATQSANEKSDDETAETRSVGGRRFRREVTAWVDISYNPSLAMTTVVRGSEQYRALVADEPTIKTIADQLSGEVILVWRGRAYRIR